MDQNSADWFAWRRNGLGASDAPVIMGESEYSTPRQLWEIKTGLVKDDQKGSFITDLGHKFEPVVRADMTLEHGFTFRPQCVEHGVIPWLRASLDGISEENRVFTEIKYVGKEKINNLKENGIIHRPHWIQMQHQFMVTGYEKGIYTCYTLNKEKTDIAEIFSKIVEPDLKFIQDELFPKLKEFWDLVSEQKEPELTDKDIKIINDEASTLLAHEYIELENQKKEIEKKLTETKEKLFKLSANSAKTQVGRLTISRVYKQGSVDYSKIEALKNIDLNEYRKNGSSYEKITIKK